MINIFKNLIYKKSGEPVVKVEKNDSQDSGIDDIIIHDDNNISNNVDSSNKLNAVDLIELISDDEDDANDLVSIIEIQDDEVPVKSISQTGITEVNKLSNSDDNTAIKNNSLPLNNKEVNGELNDDNMNLVHQNSSSISDLMLQLPDKNLVYQENELSSESSTAETDCQKEIINNSNLVISMITDNEKEDVSNKNSTERSLMIVGNEKTSVIQHQVLTNTTIATTQQSHYYVFNKAQVLKPIQHESPISPSENSQNNKVVMFVTPRRKKNQNVSSDAENNSISQNYLLNPVHVVSSTPVLASQNKKLIKVPLKLNHNSLKLGGRTLLPLKKIFLNTQPSSKPTEKNSNDKTTETAPTPSVPTPSSCSESGTSNAKSKESSVENNTEAVTPNLPATADSQSNISVAKESASITSNKENITGDTCTVPSNPQASAPVAEKSNPRPTTSSKEVQVDQDSSPKNLKRKITDDSSATASCSRCQEAPPAKKQKTQSSKENSESDAAINTEGSDVIIRLDGKSANKIEISNESLENGQQRQVISQFFNEINSVVILQPPSASQSIIRIINKPFCHNNQKSTVNTSPEVIDCVNETPNDNQTSNNNNNNNNNINKDSNNSENSNNQKTNNNNEMLKNNEKSRENPNNKNTNDSERLQNKTLNTSANPDNETLNNSKRPDNETSNNNQSSGINNQSTNNERLNTNLNSNVSENSNNLKNLNANVKIQKNESTPSSAIPLQKTVKPEVNFAGTLSPSGWLQYGTRLLNRTDKICFTGEIDEERQTAIEKLGGQITDDPLVATVLVADKFRRTFKFICAICRSIPIVATQWINDSIDKNGFVNPHEYILKDVQSEKNYEFQLSESLMKARKKQLLNDYTIVITPSVNRPSVNELKSIIKLAGGRGLVRAPKYWGPKSMIISCDEDASKVRKILEKKPQNILCPVVTTDFILSSLLRQELQINTQNLKVEMKF
ncbi:bromodomain-containing protein DDB_G0280777-like isoform X2 [Microplitis mediator]|uniref:bromodomain-containing protein DDB_G0280777-like isoform X2 n=1 Tax=Microplitis mediator TaxID=375433 RepID=UPI0025530FAE|nr:bromodomain-containing protein DDB_G0280777-like isoform X2 [Microplitis mediator]